MRLTILTDDGAAIYVQYFGVIEYNDAAHAANAGERSSEYADHYFRTAPRLETGDERYALGQPDAVRRRGPAAPRPGGRIPRSSRALIARSRRASW